MFKELGTGLCPLFDLHTPQTLRTLSSFIELTVIALTFYRRNARALWLVLSSVNLGQK